MDRQVLIQVDQGRRWLRFTSAEEIVSIYSADEVLPALERIEDAVNQRELYAAGYISYEAAPAFDAVFEVHEPGTLPHLWFGLFSKAEEFKIPDDGPSYRLGDWRPSISGGEYRAAIARIKEYIAKGKTYQVNYTFRMTSDFDGESWGLFLDLIRSQEASYAAYIDAGEFSVCSASPELFFELNGVDLRSRPMKGTAKRGKTLAGDNIQAEWLRKSGKNQAENVMIVDMIRNDMGRVSEVGSVHVPRLFEVERYPTVWQMTSTVSSRTRASIAETLTALFPCASITGAPKVSTMSIIAGLESTPRGIYTGCIGYIAPGRRAQFNVAIRTVVIDKRSGQANYGVGGGIVWDSKAKDEFDECLAKALILSERRPPFKLLESLLWTPKDGFFLLDQHMERLAASGEYFGFRIINDAVRQSLEGAAADFPQQALKIRITVDREGVVEIDPVPIEFSDKVRLDLAGQPIRSEEIFLYHKTTHREVYEQAASGCLDCDEVLLWNERREITETTTANVVYRLEGRLWTPPESCGLLPGTFRRTLIDQGLIQERVLIIDELEAVEQLFLVNSVRKWREASLVSDHGAKQ